MPYDVAIWAGPPPLNDASAEEEFERQIEILEDDDQRSPASPALQAFLDELLSLLPRLDGSNDAASPWSDGPEPGDISGDFAYLTMTFPGARAALDTVIDVARRHRVVCFDPQIGAVLKPHRGTYPASNPSGPRSMRDEERAWLAQGSTTERTYRATQAVETLGVSRRWIKRLAAIGLLDEPEQPFERIVALTTAVEVMAVREVLLSDEDITSMVEQVADALREEPSGLDLRLRVVGRFYEVGHFEHLIPDSDLPPGVIHSISIPSWVATARRQLNAAGHAHSP